MTAYDAPGPVPGPPTAGTPAGVEQALSRLAELDGRGLPEHVEVFDGVHRLLQDALATLDEA